MHFIGLGLGFAGCEGVVGRGLGAEIEGGEEVLVAVTVVEGGEAAGPVGERFMSVDLEDCVRRNGRG